MQRILFPILVRSMCFLVCVFVADTTNAQFTEHRIAAKATYLHIKADDTRATNASPINLESLGLLPDDEIRIERVGAHSFCDQPDCNACGGDIATGMIGVFSRTNVLLTGGIQDRVPAAISVGGIRKVETGGGPGGFSSDITPGLGIGSAQYTGRIKYSRSNLRAHFHSIVT